MPQSDQFNIPWVIKIIRDIKPTSILDIGIGMGGYGFLLREFLDIAPGQIKPDDWQVKIDGVEVFEGYHNPIWDYFYDDVKKADVFKIASELAHYDVIVLIDVIEHFEKDQGNELINVLLEKSDYLLISSPKDSYIQDAVYGNIHEAHLSEWDKDDFAKFFYRYIEVNQCFIVTISKDNNINIVDSIYKSLPLFRARKKPIRKRLRKYIRNIFKS